MAVLTKVVLNISVNVYSFSITLPFFLKDITFFPFILLARTVFTAFQDFLLLTKLFKSGLL